MATVIRPCLLCMYLPYRWGEVIGPTQRHGLMAVHDPMEVHVVATQLRFSTYGEGLH